MEAQAENDDEDAKEDEVDDHFADDPMVGNPFDAEEGDEEGEFQEACDYYDEADEMNTQLSFGVGEEEQMDVDEAGATVTEGHGTFQQSPQGQGSQGKIYSMKIEGLWVCTGLSLKAGPRLREGCRQGRHKC